MFYEADTEASTTPRTIYIVGTGNPKPEGASRYIISYNDELDVWHVYEGA
jgi:hypothetical protein